jgi:hypothetical protein
LNLPLNQKEKMRRESFPPQVLPRINDYPPLTFYVSRFLS